MIIKNLQQHLKLNIWVCFAEIWIVEYFHSGKVISRRDIGSGIWQLSLSTGDILIFVAVVSPITILVLFFYTVVELAGVTRRPSLRFVSVCVCVILCVCARVCECMREKIIWFCSLLFKSNYYYYLFLQNDPTHL